MSYYLLMARLQKEYFFDRFETREDIEKWVEKMGPKLKKVLRVTKHTQDHIEIVYNNEK